MFSMGHFTYIQLSQKKIFVIFHVFLNVLLMMVIALLILDESKFII